MIKTINKKGITTAALSLVAIATFATGGAIPAHAADSSTSGVNPSTIMRVNPVNPGTIMRVNPGSSSATSTLTAAEIIAKSNAAIAQRLASLAAVSARFQTMQHLSTGQIAAFQAVVQTNVDGLNALKAKINSETDVATLTTDYKSIFTSFRIYLVVIPKGYELAAADRIVTIDGMMTNLATALQARITAAQNAGHDVTTLQGALNDMKAKIADAGTQSAAVTASISGLVPDNGDASVQASNKAALAAGQTHLQTANNDLTAARADAQTIVNGLKAFGGSSVTGTSTDATK